VAAVGFCVRAGLCDEPADRRGIAHFLEHMMFRGSRNFPPGQHARRIEKLGGRQNAGTSDDVTVYHETLPARGLPEVFELEADRFQHLTLTDEHIQVERNVVLEELGRETNQPLTRAMRLIRQTVGEGHPYALGPLGRAEDLAAISRDDLEAFYRRCYRPERVFAVVVGDVAERDVQQLAERHFGSWQAGGPRASAGQAPRLEAKVGELSARLPMQLPVVARVHRLPPARDIDRPAFELLTDMLAAGQTSLIREALVARTHLCVMAGGMQHNGIHGGVQAFYGAFLPPGRHKVRRRVLREICDRIANEGPPADLFARCLKQARRRRAEQEYDAFQRMCLLGWAEVYTEGFQTYQRELEELAAVTPQRIRDMAAEIFAPANTLELDITPERMPWWTWPAGLAYKVWKR